jgi:hypothetical protein
MSLSKKVQNSGRCRDGLKEKCAERNIPPLSLLKVIPTCWNSHAMCLHQLLELQSAVNDLCMDQMFELQSFLFTVCKWDIVEQLEHISEVSTYSLHCFSFINLA